MDPFRSACSCVYMRTLVAGVSPDSGLVTEVELTVKEGPPPSGVMVNVY